MQIELAQGLLVALFQAAAAARKVTRPELQERLDLTGTELASLLSELDRAGLIDAARLTLTLPGLARAVAHQSERRRARPPLASCRRRAA